MRATMVRASAAAGAFVMLNTGHIEAAHQRLDARGLVLSAIQQEPWGRFATFSDPDGNGWILRQPPA